MTTHAAAPDRKRGRVAILSEFVRKPTMIGAIAPSSAHLAKKMMEGVDFKNAKVILEFGPGTGVFTDEIVTRLAPGAEYLAVELNKGLYDEFRRRHPGAQIVNDSAENVREICNARGWSSVDVILSGLPWASFPDDLQDRVLDAVLDVLKPGGQFYTFGYHIGTWLKAGKRFYAELPKRFSVVERSQIVWKNFPPAFIVRCRK